MKRQVRAVLSQVATVSISSLLISICAITAHAQSYPTRAVKMVVPIGYGTNSDIAARLIAERLAKKLGQPVVVENRPGAGGNIGAMAVAQAPPDGYTILFASNATHAANRVVFKSRPYDPLKDFVPLVFVAWTPMVVAVRSSNPNSTLGELLANAKKKPGTINVAVPSTSSLIVLSEINRLAQTEMTPIAYKGSAPALTDLLSGQVDATVDTLGALISFIEAGQITPLALSLSDRSKVIPRVPPITESGLPTFSVSPWNIIAAPAGTPTPVVDLLSRSLREVLDEPGVRDSLQNRSGLVFGKETSMNSQEIERFVADEIVKWERLVNDAGIQPE